MTRSRNKLLIAAALAGLGACGPAADPAATQGGGQAAVDWMNLVAARVQAEGLSPPVASRVYAYAGLSLYEAAVAGRGDLPSLAARLQGMPAPEAAPARLDSACAAAGAVSALAEAMLPRADSVTEVRALLRRQLDQRAAEGLDGALVEDSASYGQRLGQALAAWAEQDGFRATRGLPYERPAGPGLWEPTGPAKAPATEPYWGTLRPFALGAADACAPPPPPAYSEEKGSAFFAQADAVYQAGQGLDGERTAIAKFWADGAGATPTPPGHWVSILGQAITARELPMLEAVGAYARLGVALGDAFISCWQGKFRYNLLRPETYIQRHIDAQWKPLLTTPPFPEYTSGHSVASAAAALVLTEVIGSAPYTDRTHESRGLPTRSFESFDAAAREAAISRLYGGIHYPVAIDRGLEQGRCVGRAILDKMR